MWGGSGERRWSAASPSTREPSHQQQHTQQQPQQPNYLRPKLGRERGAHLEPRRGVEVAQVQVPAADVDVRVAAFLMLLLVFLMVVDCC